jgi:thymidylate kinase
MIIMLDGQDRCSKDTTIEQLRKVISNPHISVMHEAKPPSNTDPKQWAIDHYRYMLSNVRRASFSNEVLIYNRSHLGETIWGPMYRKYDTEFIFQMERDYLADLPNVFMVLLTDTSERLMARDDGKSLTQSAAELDAVRAKFVQSFDRSSIQNKKHVKLEEVKFEDVFQTVWSFINER